MARHLSRALTKLVSVDLHCTICYSTHVIPFRLSFKPGVALYEQVVYAARKAVISGQMRPGDAFPSVRALSTALKINPNTAHKAITHLVLPVVPAKLLVGQLSRAVPQAIYQSGKPAGRRASADRPPAHPFASGIRRFRPISA